jgi:hypothetical protein
MRRVFGLYVLLVISVPVAQAILDAYRQATETVATEIGAQLVVPSQTRNSLVVVERSYPLSLASHQDRRAAAAAQLIRSSPQ